MKANLYRNGGLQNIYRDQKCHPFLFVHCVLAPCSTCSAKNRKQFSRMIIYLIKTVIFKRRKIFLESFVNMQTQALCALGMRSCPSVHVCLSSDSRPLRKFEVTHATYHPFAGRCVPWLSRTYQRDALARICFHLFCFLHSWSRRGDCGCAQAFCSTSIQRSFPQYLFSSSSSWNVRLCLW